MAGSGRAPRSRRRRMRRRARRRRAVRIAATPASPISTIRAVEGPLANVRGEWPEVVEYSGAAENLQQVWIAVRANLRAVLESVTLADVVEGKLPPSITELTRDPEAWVHH